MSPGEEEDAGGRRMRVSRGWVPFTQHTIPLVCKRRMVKVYVTATPDMQDEQNAIMTTLYLSLRQHYALHHDIDFQMIAPHWHPGVDEVNYGDELIETCLALIRECEKLPAIPIFIVLLGTKYGWRPPPSRIAKREFEFLVRHLRQIDINGPVFIRNWYDEDKNTDPSFCVLKEPTLMPPQEEENPEDLIPPPEPETPDYQELAKILRVAAKSALKASHIKQDDFTKYSRSILEAELMDGIFIDESNKKNTFIFTRSIKGVELMVSSKPRAASFLDLEEGNIDVEAHKRLADLRDNQVPGCMPQSRIFKWELDPRYSGVAFDLHTEEAKISKYAQILRGDKTVLKITKYKNYLDELCGKVAEQIQNVVSSSLKGPLLDERNDTDKLCDDIVLHWKRAAVLAETFQGREEVLTQIKTYLTDGTDCPFVIYGEMGIGKSSVLARIAYDYHQLIFQEATEDAPPLDFVPVIILRLLGNPDKEFCVRQLLEDVTKQICLAYGQREPSFTADISETIEIFHDSLHFATKGNPLFIFLDAADNLSAPLMMDDLEWLPETLPEDVKMILTVTHSEENPPADNDILDDLQDKITVPECLLELGPLADMDAFKLIQARLYKEDRGLSEKQAISVALLVQKCTHPTYLQFLGDAVILWPSFYIFDPEYPPIPDNLEDILSKFIKRIEDKHGVRLVSQSFSYMSSAKTGLTEAELLDILSLDDDMLSSEVIPFDNPKPRRFPSLMWLRLRQDMSMFITEAEVNKRVVLQWKVAKMKHIIHARYILNADRKRQLHRIMADYFIGTWAKGKKKSYRYTEHTANNTVSVARMGSEERHVPAQPLVWQDFKNGETQLSRPNTTKFQEMPYHLLHSDRIVDLQQSVLFNYKWIVNYIRYVSIEDLLDSFEEALVMPGLRHSKELELLIEALSDSKLILEDNINYLSSELTCRLLQYLGQYPYLTMILKDCDYFGFQNNRITPLTPFLESTKEEVVYYTECDTGFDGHVAIASTDMPDHVLTYTIVDKLAILNMKSGDKIKLECPAEVFYSDIRASAYRDWIFGFNDGKPKYAHLEDDTIVDIYENDSGQRICRIKIPFAEDQEANNLRKLFKLTALRDRKIIFETQNHVAIYTDIVRLCNVQTGEILEGEVPWPFLLTTDERYLFINDQEGEGVFIKDFQNSKIIGTLYTPKHVTAITMITTSQSAEGFVVVAAGSAGCLNLFDMEDVISGGEVSPTYSANLLSHKSHGAKGGVGQFVQSDDHRLLLAVFMHSKARDIFQTNYVMEADLAVIGSYDCDIGDEASFSSDGKYLFHFSKRKQHIIIYDTYSMMQKFVYSLGTSILRCIPSLTGCQMLFVTKKHVVQVNMENVVRKESIKKEAFLTQEDEARSRPQSLVEGNHKRAILAEVESSAVSMTETGTKIQVQVLYLENETGLVDSKTVTLSTGEHFSEFDMPSFSSGTMASLTPDGLKMLFMCDQVHVWLPDRFTVMLVVPLFKKQGYTKLHLSSMTSDSGTNKDILIKDVPSDGWTLSKDDYIYIDTATGRQILYKPKGGEMIQKIPAIIRIFDAITTKPKSTIRLQNEKIVACGNNLLTTTSLFKTFTTIYNMNIGEAVMILEISCRLATCTSSGKVLFIVNKEVHNVIRIYSGKTFLDVRKARCTRNENDFIENMIQCPADQKHLIAHLITKKNSVFDEGVEIKEPHLYVTVHLRECSVFRKLRCERELVHFSADGTVAVDGEYVFYSMVTCEKMFKMNFDIAEPRKLSSHLAFFTDDSSNLVFLDPDDGTLNLFNLRKQAIISKCLYHKRQSTLDRLNGRPNISNLIPLYGGFQCVVIDGSTLKQFLIQDYLSWRSLKVSDKELEIAYSGVSGRARFFQSKVGNTHNPVDMTKISNKIRLVKVANIQDILTMNVSSSPLALSPINVNASVLVL